MDTSPTEYKHVCVDETGVARIAGTPYKVRILISQWQSWDLSPEALCEHHERLSLSQLYSALAYYFDHKEELDAEIERKSQEVKALQKKRFDEELRKQLRDARQRREEESER